MLLSNNWQCMPSLRGPAISRLQKIHNIELIFKVLTDKGVDLSTPEGNVCEISLSASPSPLLLCFVRRNYLSLTKI